MFTLHMSIPAALLDAPESSFFTVVEIPADVMPHSVPAGTSVVVATGVVVVVVVVDDRAPTPLMVMPVPA